MRPRSVLLLLALASVDARAQFTAPRASLTEDVRIDGNTEVFSVINVLMVSPSGRIVITQPQDHQIRVYDPAGKRLSTFGRKGDGPGEFQFMFPLAGFIGDTVWIYDNSHRRITLVAPDGKLVRVMTMATITEPQLEGPPARYSPLPRAVLGNGTAVVFISSGSDTVSNPLTGLPAPRPGQLAVVSADGVVQKRIVEAPLNRGSYTLRYGRGSAGGSVPFVAQPIDLTARDGSRMGYVVTEFTSPTAGTIRLVVIRPSGDTTLSRSYPFTGIPIPKSVSDSVYAALDAPLLGGRAQRPPEVVAAIRSAMQRSLPAVYAPIRIARFGVDGTIWIQPRAKEGEPEVWYVLDERGAPLFSLVMPARHFLHAGSRTHVWATVTDADDVASIVRMRITR